MVSCRYNRPVDRLQEASASEAYLPAGGSVNRFEVEILGAPE